MLGTALLEVGEKLHFPSTSSTIYFEITLLGKI